MVDDGLYRDLERAVRGIREDERSEQGWLGFTPQSVHSIRVDGRPGWVWVRLARGGSESPLQALNRGVPYVPDLPVEVQYRKSEGGEIPVVVGPDLSYAQVFMGSAVEVANVAPHTHEPGGGLEDMVSTRRIRGGRARVESGMTIYVDPGWYRYNDEDRYFPGGTIDLTPYIPSTTGAHCWAKVGIDPTTNALTAIKGTDIATGITLELSALDDIPFLSKLSVVGVKLDNGMTTIDRESRFADLRPFVGVRGSGGSGSGGFVWDVNAPPETPSAYDDEFDDASFDTGLWTEYDHGTIQTVSEVGELLTLTQPSQTGATLSGISQALPAGDFTIAVRIKLDQDSSADSNAIFHAGIILYEDPSVSNSESILLGLACSLVSGPKIGWTKWTAYDSREPVYYATSDPWTAGAYMYLRLRRCSTAYYLDWSIDGESWSTVDVTDHLSTYSPIITPAYMGIALYNKQTGADLNADVDFFRYRAVCDPLSDPVYGRGELGSGFIGLLDTPNDYAGAGGQAVLVKSTEDGLEFGQAGVDVEEEDGIPAVSNVKTIKVSNGTLVDNGDGSVSIVTGGGGSGGGDGPAISVTKTTSQTRTLLHEETLATNGSFSAVTGLSQDYDHLEIEGTLRSARASSTYDEFSIRFNGDTGTNYHYELFTRLDGARNSSEGTRSGIWAGFMPASTSPSGAWGHFSTQISEYASSKLKSTRSRGDDYRDTNQNLASLIDATWKNTAAITQLDFVAAFGPFLAGSTIRVYGVKDVGIVTDVSSSFAHSTASTSTPPTESELDTAFDVSAANRPPVATLDVGGSGTNVYLLHGSSNGWWYQAMTKAS